jgi:ribosomal protein S18 acetylase RimI-like enzyme
MRQGCTAGKFWGHLIGVVELVPREEREMIRYECGSGELLPRVAGLREKLKQHHVKCATRFAADMKAASLSRRSKALRAKAGDDGLRVDMAIDRAAGECVGYCIASVTPDKAGEVDSIYVESRCRGQGIGTALMRRAMGWLRKRKAKSIIIGVAAGNEQALGFYAKLGFYPRAILLAKPRRGHHANANHTRHTRH